MLLRAPSNLTLNVFTDGASTTFGISQWKSQKMLQTKAKEISVPDQLSQYAALKIPS